MEEQKHAKIPSDPSLYKGSYLSEKNIPITLSISEFISVIYYPATKSEGYSFGVVRACVRPSVHSVRPEPYLSTYWSNLIHSWYK